jgi:predicted GIY-YIG superfamily endonuclease
MISQSHHARGSGQTDTRAPTWPDDIFGKRRVDAGDLKIGDPIRGPPGLSARVAWVHDRGDVSEQSVYNLTIASIHTYRVVLAGADLLVHNGCRTSGIYVLHFANGEKYVGRSVHIERRVQQHRKNARLRNYTHHDVVKTFAAGTSRQRMRAWEQHYISTANRAAGGRRGGLSGLRNRRNEIRRR